MLIITVLMRRVDNIIRQLRIDSRRRGGGGRVGVDHRLETSGSRCALNKRLANSRDLGLHTQYRQEDRLHRIRIRADDWLGDKPFSPQVAPSAVLSLGKVLI